MVCVPGAMGALVGVGATGAFFAGARAAAAGESSADAAMG